MKDRDVTFLRRIPLRSVRTRGADAEKDMVTKVKINGIQKLTLLDYPGHVACTVFSAGCNLRCPFCHNASLVIGAPEEVMGEEEFFSFLSKRRGILDGVALTGGEPLLQRDIVRFAERIKELGFGVKLDTNGTLPDRLREIIDAGVVDYVAMDIKNSPDKYALTAGADVDLEKICQSADILLSGAIEYEFRTTVTAELHGRDDFVAIGQWIEGGSRYYLQQFCDSGELIGSGFTSPSAETMGVFADAVRPYVPAVMLRGV